MTLPTNIIFPEFRDKEDLPRYLRELNFTLQRMYEQIAQNVNGDFLTDFSIVQRKWTPILDGITVSSSFTYNHQIGWVLRQGIMVDIWFDVSWSAAGTAAGNLYLQLPYEVANSNQKPFVGVIQSSNILYTSGTEIVINAIPNTYRGEFWNYGSGVATANQLVVGAGQLIGHIRYIGKQNE